jgi:hypothetical protein
MDIKARDAQLIHAQIMLYRADQLLRRKDLPPLVRLRAVSTQVSVEKLIQAIHDGR